MATWNKDSADMANFNPRKVIRFQALKRGKEEVSINERVKLERVLGFTVSSNSAFGCDQNSSTIAYSAGCVVVLLNLKRNEQSHVINSSRKTITCLSVSADGKYVATGECGHQPHVRVWSCQDGTQVAECPGHKFGINCLAFSPNMKYVVSVGSQHDMIVNVWDWKSNVKAASNKVSSKVKAMAFSYSGNYFVTVGNRHVKFWYLEYFRSTNKYKEPVPLMGRSAILGDQRNNYFCDVACGKGERAEFTFAITRSGLLCEFNNRRLLSKWVELRTTCANCLTVGEDYIFVGCSDAIVRCFSALNMEYVTTLPRTHYLGVDVAMGTNIQHIANIPANAQYPDAVAIVYDEKSHKVSCIYNDHSLYVWDVQEIRKVGKSHSSLYHSACIWGIDMYPDNLPYANGSAKSSYAQSSNGLSALLPPGSFITCSGDDTVRVWNLDAMVSPANSPIYSKNIYSNELMKIIYMDETLSYLKDIERAPVSNGDAVNPSSASAASGNSTNYDTRNGVRCICVSQDGSQLASGDRSGNIHIHHLERMEEMCKIEAHDSEVLCLEYSKPDTMGRHLLASASRDRLIHIFDVEQEYNFLQTLDDHSSSITAVRFVQSPADGHLQMVSCGADKSLIFRSAQFNPQLQFFLEHHVVEKTTFYDLEVDPSSSHVLTACQDKNIRVYDSSTGKHDRLFKGSLGNDGTLIKLVLDKTGSYAATSCTDKSVCLYDYGSGECAATMYGHSELVTGFRFTNDGKRLISVSGDGCIFVWRLPTEMTQAIKLKSSQSTKPAVAIGSNELFTKRYDSKSHALAQPAFEAFPPPPLFADKPFANGCNGEGEDEEENGSNYRFSVGPLPLWAKKQILDDNKKVNSMDSKSKQNAPQAKGRWAQRIDTTGVTVKSIYDQDQVIPYPSGQKENGGGAVGETSNGGTSESELQRKFGDLRRQTMVISKRAESPTKFVPCPESLREITSELGNREISSSLVNVHRGSALTPYSDSSPRSSPNTPHLPHPQSRIRHLSDGASSSNLSSIPVEDLENEGYAEDEGSDSTDGMKGEVIFYPQNEDTPDSGDSDHYKVRANNLRKSDMQTLHASRLELNYKSDVPDSVTGDSEDDDDFGRSRCNFSMSTESLDRMGRRETFLKGNFESLGVEDEEGVANDPRDKRLSISAKYNKSNYRGARDYESATTSKRKQDLMKQIEETRKKLENIGWKSNLNNSKSISDLTYIPEKDVTSGRAAMSKTYSTSTNDIRRSTSMNDINRKAGRVLPATPTQKHAPKPRPRRPSDLRNLKSNNATYNSATLPSPGRSGSSLSRSTSMGTLVQQGPRPSAVNRYTAAVTEPKDNGVKPPVFTTGKVAAARREWERRQSETNSSSSSPHHSSYSSPSKHRPPAEGDVSPTESKFTTSTPIKPSISQRTKFVNSAFANSRSSSERDLSKIARDVTDRLSGSQARGRADAGNGGREVQRSNSVRRPSVCSQPREERQQLTPPRPGLNLTRNMEKSPQELPVKDHRTESADIASAILTRSLCELTTQELEMAADNIVQLYKRITMDTDMPDADRSDMLTAIQQTVIQVKQTLKPVVPYSSSDLFAPSYGAASLPQSVISSHTATLNFARESLSSNCSSSTNSTNDDKLCAGNDPSGSMSDYCPSDENGRMTEVESSLGGSNIPTPVGNPIFLLQQYSDMLLALMQQRMDPGGGGGKKSG